MSSEQIKSVAARWARLGAMFNVSPADTTPDLELLLLDTARAASENVRLFIMAATWLARHGDCVTKKRLAWMARHALEVDHRPILGFLLETAKTRNPRVNGHRFNEAIDACGKAIDARPLASSMCKNQTRWQLAEKTASGLSRKWGRWLEEFDVKEDALRPAEWIFEMNRTFKDVALTGGGLKASIVAELKNASTALSKSELARRCGASRPGVEEALRALENIGQIRMSKPGKMYDIQLCST